MNMVTLLGNLGADPELRQTQAGPVLKLRLATTEVYFDKEKNKQQRTEWHGITVWGRRGEALARILTKGAQIFVCGRLHTSSYEKDGVKRWRTEIVAEDVILTGSRGGAHGERGAPNGVLARTPLPAATVDALPF